MISLYPVFHSFQNYFVCYTQTKNTTYLDCTVWLQTVVVGLDPREDYVRKGIWKAK